MKLSASVIERLHEDFHFIDICDDPYLIVSELSKCKHVISSSLHGLIVSEAMGIPTCYLRTYIRVNDFKVHDYYQGCNVKIEDVKQYWLGKNDITVDKSKIRFTHKHSFNIT